MEGILLPCCSIFFSILICAVYFTKKRVNIIENSMYGTMLVVIVIDSFITTALQVFGFYELTPTALKIISILNKIDFILLLIYVSNIFMYMAIITIDKIRKNYGKFRNSVFIINLIFSILVCLGDVNVISQNNHYSIDGTASSTLLVCVGLYIILSLIIVLTNLKKVDKRHFPIICMVIILGLLSIIFKVNPYLIVVSISLTFLNYIMYFTIENPDVKMLEEVTAAKIHAEKANRAKSDFLSSMSHEIRTPLNAIVGFSEDIHARKGEGSKEIMEDAEYILEASKTLLEIVGNILDINKIESNKMEIIEVKYNPKEEIETLAKIDETRIGDKNINFTVNIDDNIPYELLGDKPHIKEVVNNLLSNAIKYTEEGSINLVVKCINENDICNLTISVKDTGRGIKNEDLDKLFTKFERLDAPINSTVEGTGLGLVITKKLVEMMDGKINVDSIYGEGSTFTVNIPQKISIMTRPVEEVEKVEDTEEVEVLNEEQNKQDTISRGKKKVLIVDDNNLNIKVARRNIEDFNFEIDECYNGEECLDKVKNGNEYDLILMDIMMPVMDGEEALRKLKENPNFNIPTIALTADAVAGAEEKYLSEGFIDYVAKPFTKAGIKEKLDKIFNNK